MRRGGGGRLCSMTTSYQSSFSKYDLLKPWVIIIAHAGALCHNVSCCSVLHTATASARRTEFYVRCVCVSWACCMILSGGGLHIGRWCDESVLNVSWMRAVHRRACGVPGVNTDGCSAASAEPKAVSWRPRSCQ